MPKSFERGDETEGKLNAAEPPDTSERPASQLSGSNPSETTDAASVAAEIPPEEESPACRAGKAAFEARFESLRSGYKAALKATNGFLAGLTFAEAKRARDAGQFAAAQDLLGELDALIKLSQVREEERIRKTEKRFMADYKSLEQKARREGGANLQTVRGHLRAAKGFADKREFIEANRELHQVQLLFDKGPNPTTGKSRPFTINIIP